MAWWQTGDKLSLEPVLIKFLVMSLGFNDFKTTTSPRGTPEFQITEEWEITE